MCFCRLTHTNYYFPSAIKRSAITWVKKKKWCKVRYNQNHIICIVLVFFLLYVVICWLQKSHLNSILLFIIFDIFEWISTLSNEQNKKRTYLVVQCFFQTIDRMQLLFSITAVYFCSTNDYLFFFMLIFILLLSILIPKIKPFILCIFIPLWFQWMFSVSRQ